MSDLAKKCADGVRAEVALNLAFDENKQAAVNTALAAFIEAAQAVRNELVCDCTGMPSPHEYGERVCRCEPCKAATAHDAALRDLAQSMEVSDD